MGQDRQGRHDQDRAWTHLEIFFLGDELSDQAPGLFGWVPAAPRGQGRPPFVWTHEKSNKLMILFASGYVQKEAAAVIGCDVKTLRKVFPVECRAQANAALVVRSGMMAKLIGLAEQGSVPAMKQLDKMIAAEQLRATANRVAERGAAERKPAPVGKKEAAKEAAGQVSGIFAARMPPAAMMN